MLVSFLFLENLPGAGCRATHSPFVTSCLIVPKSSEGHAVHHPFHTRTRWSGAGGPGPLERERREGAWCPALRCPSSSQARDSVSKSFCFIIASWGYSLHVIQFTYIQCLIQWFLEHSQVRAAILQSISGEFCRPESSPGPFSHHPAPIPRDLPPRLFPVSTVHIQFIGSRGLDASCHPSCPLCPGSESPLPPRPSGCSVSPAGLCVSAPGATLTVLLAGTGGLTGGTLG